LFRNIAVVLESGDLKGMLAEKGLRGIDEQVLMMGTVYLNHSTHFSNRKAIWLYYKTCCIV
jgi:hypothetical protein